MSRAPHRPRKDPAVTRINRTYRLHPVTIVKIDGESKRTGESSGQVVDRLAEKLPTERPMSKSPRSGFTAIELMVVITVMVILLGLAIPSLVGALRKGKVNDAANCIIRASSQAKQLAKTRAAVASDFYGLIIVNDEVPAYVAVTFGHTGTKADILHQQNDPSKPALIKYPFNRNVLIYEENDAALATDLGWCYQYRTGYPIQDAKHFCGNAQPAPSGSSKTIDIGVDTGNGVLYPFLKKSLSLRTMDGKYRTGIAIYRIGLANVQDY
jgi:prepilin-type N-terminal cleavage/methylation domain-containing protein